MQQDVAERQSPPGGVACVLFLRILDLLLHGERSHVACVHSHVADTVNMPGFIMAYVNSNCQSVTVSSSLTPSLPLGHNQCIQCGVAASRSDLLKGLL